MNICKYGHWENMLVIYDMKSMSIIIGQGDFISTAPFVDKDIQRWSKQREKIKTPLRSHIHALHKRNRLCGKQLKTYFWLIFKSTKNMFKDVPLHDKVLTLVYSYVCSSMRSNQANFARFIFNFALTYRWGKHWWQHWSFKMAAPKQRQRKEGKTKSQLLFSFHIRF